MTWHFPHYYTIAVSLCCCHQGGYGLMYFYFLWQILSLHSAFFAPFKHWVLVIVRPLQAHLALSRQEGDLGLLLLLTVVLDYYLHTCGHPVSLSESYSPYTSPINKALLPSAVHKHCLLCIIAWTRVVQRLYWARLKGDYKQYLSATTTCRTGVCFPSAACNFRDVACI